MVNRRTLIKHRLRLKAERKLIKKRLKIAKYMVLGGDRRLENTPGKLKKQKPSYTYGSSLKPWKRIESKWYRRINKQRIEQGKDIKESGRNSVKYNYW